MRSLQRDQENTQIASFWMTHSPLDYPELFHPAEVVIRCPDGTYIKAGGVPYYRPDLGNIPLPFPAIPISSSEALDPSAATADVDANTETRTHPDTPGDA